MNKMLSSWKEIAHFFGKGVRTVQRWEKTLDLPIRRPPGAPSNVVLARTSDLEEWMHRSAALRESVVDPAEDELQHAVTELEREVRLLAGPQPQAVEVGERPVPTSIERVRTLTYAVRGFNQNSERHNLKRVA